MTFYISLFTFFFFGIIKNEILKSKKNNFIIFLIIFLFCFSYQMGTDWLSYQSYYEKALLKVSWKEILKYDSGFEIGYIIINLFFYNLGISYEIFIGIVLSICTFVILKYIQKNSKNYYLAIFVFFISFLLAALVEPLVRQLIALTLFIISIKYIERKRAIKYMFIIFLATLFHKSAFFLFPLYFIKYINISIKKLLVMLFLLKMTLLKIFPILLFYFEGYYNYLYFGRYSVQKQIGITNILMLILYMFILFFIYGKKRNKIIYNFSILFIVIYFFSPNFSILSRMNLYFSPFIAITFSYVSDSSLNKKNLILFYNHNLLKITKVMFIFLVFTVIFYRKSVHSELFKYAYLNYKNYIFVFFKGELKKDFNEKKENYEKNIKELMKL